MGKEKDSAGMMVYELGNLIIIASMHKATGMNLKYVSCVRISVETKVKN